jgi:hypothetical protein
MGGANRTCDKAAAVVSAFAGGSRSKLLSRLQEKERCTGRDQALWLGITFSIFLVLRKPIHQQ